MTAAPHGQPALAPTRAALADLVDPVRRRGGTVALVPTMGALHQGHASLLRLARERAGADGLVVASIFVNPLQFGPGEDLDRYPRTLEQDLAVCAAQGVDVVFAPSAQEVYPGGDPQVSIAPGPVADVLEGASRPGHFAGVLTVVAKLFGLVRPDVAVFGEKDYQQLVLVRRMVADLCLPVEVVGAETAREPDGLARSSRNRYLDEDERLRAAAVPRVLEAAVDAARLGVDAALDAARGVLTSRPGVEVDYLALTDPELRDLAAPDAAPVTAPTPGRVLLAARVGSTRLIDNLPLVVGVAGSRLARTPPDPIHAPAPETADTGGHR